jgi:hypothetical protein
VSDVISYVDELRDEISKLKQQLAERDELILELEGFDYKFVETEVYEGWTARGTVKHQALLDEIRGRV